MIKHIILTRLQEQAEGHTKEENALIIKEKLLSLKEKISVIKSITVGINLPNAKNTNYDVCLICEFATWDDLNTYAVHPEHVKVAEYIAKCRIERGAIDYEF